MQLSVSLPDADPTVFVKINGREVELLADSGAVFSCLQPKDASHLPLSGHYVRTIGFAGLSQLTPVTHPVHIEFEDQSTDIPVLVSPNTPVGLLGRDALCNMNCVITCTPQGCEVHTAKRQFFQAPVLSTPQGALVYWLGALSQSLLQPAHVWAKFIAANLPGSTDPVYDPHCTLQYFKNGGTENIQHWLSSQPKQVLLESTSIIIGPQGAAMSINDNDYLTQTFTVGDSVPHVTLRIADGHSQVEMGTMMVAARSAVFVPTKENPSILVSDDRRFLKLLTSSQGASCPHAVSLTLDSMHDAAQPLTLMDKMLKIVPDTLWSKHGTDIGLVQSAQPVRVVLRPGARPPWKFQYPLKEAAILGIEPQINGLLAAGVLAKTTTPIACTPLLPTLKADKVSYRLVHDLRAVNEVCERIPVEVPDPHVLFASIPPEATCFTVCDLAGAFFSVPLAEESQGLFGFQFKGEHYVYRRLPQGFCDSPSIFNKVLKEDLERLIPLIESTVLCYADDIILCAPNVSVCFSDSCVLLNALSANGHRLSKSKLQFCQASALYLGHEISHGRRGLSEAHLLAIKSAPKPRTVREVMKFLGMLQFSAAWIEGYTTITGPLRALIKETGTSLINQDVVWTPDALLSFETLKKRLLEAPALALVNYHRPFLLYASTSEDGCHACAVLTQPADVGVNPQPIAYYSMAYSDVEMGLQICFRALVGVYLMYEKATAVTMGYPVTILVHHAIKNLLNHGKYALTASRIRDYHRMLEQPDVSVVRCNTVNPSESLPVASDGEPHDCVFEAEQYSRLRSDLQAIPLTEVDVEYWTDGSCYRVGDSLRAGYAVVQAQGDTFVVIRAEAVPQPCSAQLAELIALTEACLLAAGIRVTIYTDSAYAMNVCHLFGAVWKNRGFISADGSPVKHYAQIVKLLAAMMEPKAIAITKCAAHRTDMSRITKGNTAADEAAKTAARANTPEALFVTVEPCEVELEEKVTMADLAMLQDDAAELDKQLWLARGATKDSTGLYRNHEGLLIAPPDLLTLLIHEAHGVSHASRGEVNRKITQEYGFWAPYLLNSIDQMISRCTICLKHNIRRGVLTSPGYIPTPSGPFQELVIDYVDMIKPVEGKRYLLVVCDRFSRWVDAVPTKREDAASVAKFLCRHYFPTWGIPLRISSDNGKAFVDKTIKLILQKLCIKQRLGCIYRPSSQGLCERQNGILKNRICKISEHTGLSWVDALPLALWASRSSEVRHLHMTPYEMATGRRMSTPGIHMASGKGPNLALLDDGMKAYVRYMSNLHKKIATYVCSKQEREEQEEAENATVIRPGDKVYVKVHRRKWYTERRQGPYPVVRSTGTAVQIEGSPVWHHVNNCVKAPRDEDEGSNDEEREENLPPQQNGEPDEPCSQKNDPCSRHNGEQSRPCPQQGTPRSQPDEEQGGPDYQPDGVEPQVRDGSDYSAGKPDDLLYNIHNGGIRACDQARRFDSIDTQYVPEQTGLQPTGGSSQPAEPPRQPEIEENDEAPVQTGRPARTKRKPERYRDAD